MKLEELLDNDLFVFDLDRTIWECYNKYNRSIWAKQLLYPYKKLNDDLIEDDVLSQCILQPNIRDILKYLKENRKDVAFLSCGASLRNEFQPSIEMLKLFNIYYEFNAFRTLEYKTFSKYEFLQKLTNRKIVIFDDDVEVTESCKQLKDAIAINRYSFKGWKELL